MSVAQPIKLERAAAAPSDSERLVDQLANRIGGLGVELADVAGNLQEVAGRVLLFASTLISSLSNQHHFGSGISR